MKVGKRVREASIGWKITIAATGVLGLLWVVFFVRELRGDNVAVRVRNDLTFEVALTRCESASAPGADPIFIGSGDNVSIRPGRACAVNGPTGRSGPGGILHDEGPYMGCLAMPPKALWRETTVAVSELKGISLDGCPVAGSHPG